MCNVTNQPSIIPPHLLEHIAKSCDENDKEHVLKTLDHVKSLMKQSATNPPLRKKDRLQIDKGKSN
ncbi:MULTISPECIES: protealysin propeptide domain-containing protein [Xenorhabdus]|uniref:protealysin propeptide domain-containing protein n=1 Tax=Xenorhabdus TaxID=626 RepID=UPI00064844CA|nr:MULTISPECIES: protealysin propeptide domain-containing protein [Xenorhabdus]MBC8945855.1 peptidase M4 [Xenorhabdus indica]